MQWTYEIRGSHPHYKIPEAKGGRLNNQLTRHQRDVMSKRISEKKNFLRNNLNATKYASVEGSPTREASPQKQRSVGTAGRSDRKMHGSPGSNKNDRSTHKGSPSRTSNY